MRSQLVTFVLPGRGSPKGHSSCSLYNTASSKKDLSLKRKKKKEKKRKRRKKSIIGW